MKVEEATKVLLAIRKANEENYKHFLDEALIAFKKVQRVDLVINDFTDNEVKDIPTRQWDTILNNILNLQIKD